MNQPSDDPPTTEEMLTELTYVVIDLRMKMDVLIDAHNRYHVTSQLKYIDYSKGPGCYELGFKAWLKG